MTRKQEANLLMLQVLLVLFADNKPILDKLKMIAKIFNQLDTKVGDIKSLKKKQKVKTTGVTAVKNITLAELKEAGYSTLTNVKDIAEEEKRLDIVAELSITKTEFNKGGQDKVVARCLDVLKKAQEFESNTKAKDYFVDKDSNDAFENTINSFPTKKVDQSTTKQDNKKITQDIKLAFEATSKLLSKLDENMEANAKKKYPDFYSQYLIARKVNPIPPAHHDPKDPPKGPTTPPPAGV